MNPYIFREMKKTVKKEIFLLDPYSNARCVCVGGGGGCGKGEFNFLIDPKMNFAFILICQNAGKESFKLSTVFKPS